MRPDDISEGSGAVGANGRPTTINGRIPPTVRRVEVIEVTHTIGSGVAGDPYRHAVSLYRKSGEHVSTISDGELLAVHGRDAKEARNG